MAHAIYSFCHCKEVNSLLKSINLPFNLLWKVVLWGHHPHGPIIQLNYSILFTHTHTYTHTHTRVGPFKSTYKQDPHTAVGWPNSLVSSSRIPLFFLFLYPLRCFSCHFPISIQCLHSLKHSSVCPFCDLHPLISSWITFCFTEFCCFLSNLNMNQP